MPYNTLHYALFAHNCYKSLCEMILMKLCSHLHLHLCLFSHLLQIY